MLINTKEILLKAKQYGYAVAQPNAWDLNSLRALIRASEARSSPVIIGLAEIHFIYMDTNETMNLIKYYAEKTESPVAIHLDHGTSFEALIKAIRSGFTSVMIDASKQNFEENLKRTSEIVKIAHKCGVTVEAELGHVGQGADYSKIAGKSDQFTNPIQAKKFVELTEIDSLAIAIGTAHGEYIGTPKLDFERLKEIANIVDIPLVLHGGSGTGDITLSKCVKCGISKINVCTDLMKAATEKVKDIITSKSYADAVMVGEDAIKERLEHYFEVFGSINRSKDITGIKTLRR